MKKLWQTIKEHSIPNQVVAGLILAILVGIFSLIFKSSIIGFASKQYTVPLYVFLLIGIIPNIVIIIAHVLYKRRQYLFLQEFGVFKDRNSENYFCCICKSYLQKVDDVWYCNKCDKYFGKRKLNKSPERKVISQGIKNSRW
jgi:hypothetical protein